MKTDGVSQNARRQFPSVFRPKSARLKGVMIRQKASLMIIQGGLNPVAPDSPTKIRQLGAESLSGVRCMRKLKRHTPVTFLMQISCVSSSDKLFVTDNT
jgi:hypothetical protein